jgi:hypothetical protein
MARLKYVLLAGALLAALGIFAAACDDDAESQNNAQQSDVDRLTQSIDELNTRVSNDEMMYAILQINSLGLHDMDEGLRAGTIESSYAPNTRTAVRLLALTGWSDDLKPEADTLHGHAVDLLKALEDEDVEAASAASAELHEGAQQFTDKVWAVVAADLPPDAGGVAAPDDDEEEGTPAAGETPADDHEMAETPAAGATP